ncbi:MAG: response regulator [Deltaproteobacteria bacterium]|nr:response regulator [Deltaproteobacteria bacterium]
MAKIFIIDDDQDITDSLTMILEGNGHAVESKADTDNLVSAIMDAGPDVIILDIMFPEDPQAGFKAARVLHKDERVRAIPVLFLSAVNQSIPTFSFSDSDISDDFMPVEAFIEKPVEPKILLAKIDALLAPKNVH